MSWLILFLVPFLVVFSMSTLFKWADLAGPSGQALSMWRRRQCAILGGVMSALPMALAFSVVGWLESQSVSFALRSAGGALVLAVAMFAVQDVARRWKPTRDLLDAQATGVEIARDLRRDNWKRSL